MAWWEFEINLQPTKEDKIARRATLDRYGRYAFASALAPVVAVFLFRLASWAWATLSSSNQRRQAPYHAVSESELAKPRAGHRKRGPLRRAFQRAKWWLSEPVFVFGSLCGQRDEWVFGLVWFVWLSVLCVRETGHGK